MDRINLQIKQISIQKLSTKQHQHYSKDVKD